MVIHARSGPFEFGRHFFFFCSTISSFETTSNSEWIARIAEFSGSVAGSTYCG